MRPSGVTSAVGTNQMPVSPKNVVVAGRVSSGGCCCCGDEEVCADTAAAHSAHATARPNGRDEVVKAYLPGYTPYSNGCTKRGHYSTEPPALRGATRSRRISPRSRRCLRTDGVRHERTGWPSLRDPAGCAD